MTTSASVDDELFVAVTVHRWAGEAFPDVPSVADGAVRFALRAFAGGASAVEACREGHRYIQCCLRHPCAALVRPAPRVA